MIEGRKKTNSTPLFLECHQEIPIIVPAAPRARGIAVIARWLNWSILPLNCFVLAGSISSVKRSAGILMFRLSGRKPMVLLVHPGGPFWRNKDKNCWSIPKGEFGDDETAEAAAVREFEEETGFRPAGVLVPLGEAIQAGG